MRTTIDVEDDVLSVARDLAREKRTTLGKVISDLARRTLLSGTTIALENGFPTLPVLREGQVVTMELVNRLRDEIA